MVKNAQFNTKHHENGGLSLTNDLIFFLTYGSGTKASDKALVSLLNIVLDRREDPIMEVEITNTVHKGFHPGDKATVMDIQARSQAGERFNVEMQRFAPPVAYAPFAVRFA